MVVPAYCLGRASRLQYRDRETWGSQPSPRIDEIVEPGSQLYWGESLKERLPEKRESEREREISRDLQRVPLKPLVEY